MAARLRFVPRTAALVLGAAALTIVVMLVSGGDEARATHFGCGQVITTDTTLDSDLIDCPNNGIVIGADGITLDLNGHVIDGDGAPVAMCPQNEPCDIGVDNDGHSRVTIRRGSVRQFELGVFVGRVRRNRLLGLSVSRNRFVGGLIALSARSLVRNSSFSRNGLRTDQAGLNMFHSPHNRFLGNSFRRNGDIGIFAQGIHDNLFKRNVFSGNREAGVLMEGDNRNQFRRNRLSQNGVGFDLGGNRNAIVGNRILRSRGMPGQIGVGIFISQGRRNLVARNLIARSSNNGIRVGLPPREVGRGPHAVRTVVRGNRLRVGGEGPGQGFPHLERDGVFVFKTAIRTLLLRNRARDFKDDGFDVRSRRTKLRRNRAFENGDLGIAAVRGVIDGGGNVASGNRDPFQCLNVLCS
jgi:parallel beta-helix repeat protein